MTAGSRLNRRKVEKVSRLVSASHVNQFISQSSVLTLYESDFSKFGITYKSFRGFFTSVEARFRINSSEILPLLRENMWQASVKNDLPTILRFNSKLSSDTQRVNANPSQGARLCQKIYENNGKKRLSPARAATNRRQFGCRLGTRKTN